MAQIPTPAMTAAGPAPDGYWIAAEPTPRRVRVVFGGETVADSKRALLLRERGRLPAYYFPKSDVRTDLLVATGHTTHDPSKGPASYSTLKVGTTRAENAVWSFAGPLAQWREIADYVAFEWDKMDAWYEEDEEVFVHPRDPYKRVDVLQSSRHIRVVFADQTVAESRRPCLLFETGMPTRYYLPPEDVRTELLEVFDTHTRCPYKGLASYWSVRVGDTVGKDLVWSYLDPIPECPKIKGLLSFFNERVGAIYVDGEIEPKPGTRWSLDV